MKSENLLGPTKSRTESTDSTLTQTDRLKGIRGVYNRITLPESYPGSQVEP